MRLCVVPAGWFRFTVDKNWIAFVDCESYTDLEKYIRPPSSPVSYTQVGAANSRVQALIDKLRRAAIKCGHDLDFAVGRLKPLQQWSLDELGDEVRVLFIEPTQYEYLFR